jgi:hypothetical protein
MFFCFLIKLITRNLFKYYKLYDENIFRNKLMLVILIIHDIYFL